VNICTIIAKNYVAFARVLAHSFREHHPDGTVSVLVIDHEPGYIDPAEEPFDLYTPADLDIDGFADMATAYDILELSTAVKPWFLRHLIDRHESGRVMYLDPDIQVTDSLAPVDELIAEHGIVLIPHLTAPIPDDGKKPSETDILIAGVHNLGFIGVGRSDAADKMLEWWSGWLREHCTVDPARGYFVDQRWMDLVPGMFPELHLLRDHGYDVAYWNVHSRELTERDGSYFVDGVPLRFYHYSGFDPETPHVLSKHQDRVLLSERPALAALCEAYAEKLLAAGHREARDWPYVYKRLADGTPLDSRLRKAYRDARESGAEFDSIFEPEGARQFIGYLSQPAPRGGEHGVTRFLYDYWKERVDLQTVYPDLRDPESAKGFLGWAHAFGATEVPIPEVLLPPQGAEMVPPAERPSPTGAEVSGRSPVEGVNVAGYFRAELGVGEAARQILTGLDSERVPVAPLGLVAPDSRQGHAFGHSHSVRGPFPVNVVCVNADGLPTFAADVGDEFFAGRYTIGVWWWEVARFPDRFFQSFDYLDEVWAGTAHVAEAISQLSPIPVVKVTIPVAPAPAPVLRRQALGFPDDFTFLLVYDYNSVFERKNPLGHVEAFRRAFPEPGSGASLVLKSINHHKDPESHERLKLAVSEHPDVHLIDEYVPAEVKNSMIAACDCYVSLHRAEGFGITLAEAMYFGKPVIATGYSGNLDFMSHDNSYLVDYSLVPIGEGAEPYPPQGVWAEPNLDHAAELMRHVFGNRQEAADRARRGAAEIRITHSPHAAGLSFQERLVRVATRTPRHGGSDRGPVVLPPSLREAGELVGQGPPRAGGMSPAKRLVRKVALRAVRPYSNHATKVQRKLVEAMEELAQTVSGAELETRRDSSGILADLRRVEDRLRAQDVVAHDDLVKRIGAVDQRFDPMAPMIDANGEFRVPTPEQLDFLDRVLAETQGAPYVGDPLRERMTDPAAGVVVGYSAADQNGGARLADVLAPPEAVVRERMHRYLPWLKEAGPVLDLRCGRGELLDVLRDEGVEFAGVDADPALVDVCRSKGHDAVQVGTPVDHLRSQTDGSLGAVFAAHVLEELAYDELTELLGLVAQKLRPGGVLVAESANPHSFEAMRTLWVDLRARRPVFPEVALALCRAGGYGSAFYFHPNGTGDVHADAPREREYAVVATR
jgi:glycosyltransferase involved in cell wall biosynthesis/SAM-dependent methyltransferase